MDDRTALLIPSRGFDSRSHLVIPKVLDCMPSGVGAGLKHVINSVRSNNGRFENPTTGKSPAQAFPEDAREHVDHSSVLTKHVADRSVSCRMRNMCIGRAWPAREKLSRQELQL